MPVRRYVRDSVRSTLAEVAPLATFARNETDSQAQHCWRIALKKLRYRLEIVTPVIMSSPDPLLVILKRYQELLGDRHDLDGYRELVQSLAPDGETASELIRIISRRRSKVWADLLLLEAEQPWGQLAARIEDIL